MGLKLEKNTLTQYVSKLRSTLRDTPERVREAQRTAVRDTYLKELQDLTKEFDTDLSSQFFLYTKLNKNSYRTNIRIKPSQFTRTSSSGGQVSYQELFDWLNDGTNNNYAFMPEDFGNETFVNSLHTESVAYERFNIKVNKKLAQMLNKPGITGRHWTELLEVKYPVSYYKREIEKVVRDIRVDLENN